MVKKFTAAVIGCGNIGANESKYNKLVSPGTHAGSYSKHPKTELIALVEKDESKYGYLGKEYPKAKIFRDSKSMYKEIIPDIVSVATPTAAHYSEVMAAAKNRCRAILCEKPITDNIKEAQQMIRACRKSGSLLFINHTRHFDPIITKWSKKVRQGLLGDIFQGNAYYYNGFFNNGTHLIDLLRKFLGEVDSVKANYNKNTSNNPKDLNIDAEILFRNGARVTLHSLSKNYGYFGFRLIGEKGMLETENLCYQIIYRKKISNKNFKGFFQLSDDIKSEGKPRSYMFSVIKHVVSCLEKKSETISTGEDGFKILGILKAIKKSAELQGDKIKL